MQCSVNDEERRRARAPHELFMLNLAFFHLLLTPATIAVIDKQVSLGGYTLQIGDWAMLFPPLVWITVILLTWLRTRRAERAEPWFVMIHWRLAMRRYRLMIFAYLASALLIGMGGVIDATASDPHMGTILFTVVTRIGVMPTVVMVLVAFALENSALAQAKVGEAPDGLAERYPPPAGLCGDAGQGEGR